MSHNADHLSAAIIIAAHPDDEILWFSSILDQVDQIIICYLDVDSKPEWSSGRHQSISSYPLRNLSCLGVQESEAFDGANWSDPVITPYGIEIKKTEGSVECYKKNFDRLKNLLAGTLEHYRNVYTHNPWGEYGHEEHIQVYRAVKSLQHTMGFNLWYTNYFSNKSALLMSNYIARAMLMNHCLPTNRKIAATIMDLYKRHGCWTWYDDYVWPDHECFILDGKPGSQKETFGKTLPLNFVKIWSPPKNQQGIKATIKQAIHKMADKL